MKLCFCLFLMLSFGALSAQTEGRFINYTGKPGDKVAYGQTVEINMYTFLKDSLMFSTVRDGGGPNLLTLPDSAQQGGFSKILPALLQMSEGDSASYYLTLDSSVIETIKKGFPSMGDVKEVHYVIVLLNLFTQEELDARMTASEREETERKQMEANARARAGEVSSLVATTRADYKSGKLADLLKKTASGLEYYILKEGSGPNFMEGEKVNTHYYGVLLSNGTMFDNTFETGKFVSLPVGELLPGFNEGLRLLNDGSAAMLFIPANLAYGDKGVGGQIPPNADLMFYIELKK